MYLNAVKCNLTELTTRSTSFTCPGSGLLDMRIHQDTFVGILVSIFLSVSVFPERGDSLEAVFPPVPALP